MSFISSSIFVFACFTSEHAGESPHGPMDAACLRSEEQVMAGHSDRCPSMKFVLSFNALSYNALFVCMRHRLFCFIFLFMFWVTIYYRE